MSKKELTPNYEIMFKSAVSMLQTTYSELKTVQRNIYDYSHTGWFNNDGYYCITHTDVGFMADLVKKEHYLAEQLQYCIQEVERLRKLKGEKENG